MNLEIIMPSDEKFVDFKVPEGVLGLSLSFESDKITNFNFLIYDDQDQLQGQYFDKAHKGSIWLGPSKALSSAYSLSYKGARSFKIINLTCSLSGLANKETRGTISFYTDKDRYIEDYLAVDYVTPVHRWVDDEGRLTIDYSRIPQAKEGLTKRWFKGDFHSHTLFSDGLGTREDANYTAVKYGLDFFFPADHAIFPLEWPKTEDVQVLPASEITTIFGHFNYFFGESPYKEALPEDHTDPDEVIKLLEEKTSGLLTLNHPFRWTERLRMDSLPLSVLDGIEVINSPLSTVSQLANVRASQAWSRLWNMGHRVFGRGGSDVHAKLERYDAASDDFVRLGMPATFVYGRDLSGDSIKEGLEACQVAFSCYGRPSLSFSSSPINEDLAGLSAIGVQADLDEVQLDFKLVDYEGDKDIFIEWIVDGRLYKEEPGLESTMTFSSDQASWIRVDVKDGARSLIGSTNPVQIKPIAKRGQTWADMLAEAGPINLVILDKDGTMVDSTALWKEASLTFIHSLDLEEGQEAACIKAIGLEEDGSVLPDSPLDSALVDEIAQAISSRLARDISREALKDQLISHIEDQPQLLKARDGLSEALASLKEEGLTLACVSSDDHDLILSQLQALGVLDYFDHIHGADTAPAKPSPQVLLDLEKKTGLGLDEMAMVGDSASDMQLGSYTGLVLAIESASSPDQIKYMADHVIEELGEILDCIN